MADTATTIPPRGLGSLHLSDFWKGLIKTLSGFVVGLIVKTIHERQFPSYDEIAPLLEAALYFLVGYLGINLGTNNVGQLFTKDQPTVTVGAKELDKVIDKAAETKPFDVK